MGNLIDYLRYQPVWRRLPRMPRMYSTEYDPKLLDHDTVTLMQQTHVRSPQGVEVLKRKHGAASARELVQSLPPARYQRHIRARFMGLIRRTLGLTSFDPMRTIYLQHRKQNRRR